MTNRFQRPCRSSTLSGKLLASFFYPPAIDAHRDPCRRSMQRNPRAPRRSTTPTSANFPSPDTLPPATPTSPGAPKPLYLCSPFVEAALVKGNFKTIVMLPKYADVMEWVAVNSASPRPCSILSLRCVAFIFLSTSLRILPEPQPILRRPLRMLHGPVVPVHVRWFQVRKPIALMLLDIRLMPPPFKLVSTTRGSTRTARACSSPRPPTSTT